MDWEHSGVTSPEARKEIREYIDRCIKEAVAEKKKTHVFYRRFKHKEQGWEFTNRGSKTPNVGNLDAFKEIGIGEWHCKSMECYL